MLLIDTFLHMYSMINSSCPFWRGAHFLQITHIKVAFDVGMLLKS